MIDVIIADEQELFRVGMAEVLAVAGDVHIVGLPQSPEQLLNTLKEVNPHVLILSTNFLSGFSKIQRILNRRQTALLVLAEENDRVAYVRWLRVQGIVYRSMDGPVIVDAIRRVARGELFVQRRSFDTSEDFGSSRQQVQISELHDVPEGGRERRKMGPRFRISVPATFQWQGPDGVRRESKGTTRDISGYGVFIHTDSAPLPGDSVQVIVNMPPLQAQAMGMQLYGKGVAVRVEPGDDCAPEGFAAEVLFQSGWASALSHAVQ